MGRSKGWVQGPESSICPLAAGGPRQSSPEPHPRLWAIRLLAPSPCGGRTMWQASLSWAGGSHPSPYITLCWKVWGEGPTQGFRPQG